MPAKIYQLADLRIDIPGRRVERVGHSLDVAGLSFDLLACLLESGQAVVTFDELIARVWAPTIVSDEAVTQRIKLLRQALGDDSRHPRYIRSVRGKGYQLIAQPEHIEDAQSANAVAPEALGDAIAAWNWSRPRVLLPAGAALLVAVAACTWLALQAAPSAPEAELLERARYYASIGQKENNERAIALYEQALRQSPNLTSAALGLSRAYSARVCLYNFPLQWLDRAEALARNVLRSEPRNALAYTSLAYVEDCRGFIDAAIRDYEHAVRLDPAGQLDALSSVAYLYEVKGRLVDALHTNLLLGPAAKRFRYFDIQVARTLELLGLPDAAEPRYARSFQLYPDNVFSNVAWPRFLMSRGRVVEARAALDEALARGTDRNDLQLLAGELALLRDERSVAARHFERASAMRPHATFAATLAIVHGAEPPSAALLRERIDAVKRSIDAGDRWPDNWLEIAVMQIALGDTRAASASLRSAVDAGFLDKAYLQISPLFQPLASESDFASVLAEITRRTDEQRRAVLDTAWVMRAITVSQHGPKATLPARNRGRWRPTVDA